MPSPVSYRSRSPERASPARQATQRKDWGRSESSDPVLHRAATGRPRQLTDAFLSDQRTSFAGDGTFGVSWRCQYASRYSMRVYVEERQIQTPDVLVDVLPAASDPLHSWLDGSPLDRLSRVSERRGVGSSVSEAAKGVVATFRVVAADRFGNRRQTGGDALQVDFAGPTYFEGVAQDHGGGTYTVSYVAKTAGRYTLHVIMQGKSVGGQSYSACVRDGVSRLGCYCIAPSRKESVVGGRASFHFIPLDSRNRPWKQDPRTFSTGLELKPETAFKAHWLRDAVPCLTEREVEELLQSADLADDAATKDETPNPLSNTFGYLFGKEFADRAKAAGRARDGAALSRRVGMNVERRSDGTAWIEWTPRHAGAYVWRIDCDGEDVSPQDEVLHVDPGDIDPRNCVLFGAGDSEGNAIVKGGARVVVSFEALEEIPISVTDLKDGRYLISYQFRSAGEFQGRVEVDRVSCPVLFKCEVLPSVSCGSLFRVEGDTSRHGAAGKREIFHIQSRDAFGNARRFGGDVLTVTLRKEGGFAEVPCRVDDHQNGTYSILYSARAAGRYLLTCAAGRAQEVFHVTGLEIFPGPPSPAACWLTGEGLQGASPRCIASVFIHIADAFHNPRSLEPLPCEIQPSDAEQSSQGISSHGTELRTRDNVLKAFLYLLVDGERHPGGMVTISSASERPTCYRLGYRAYQSGLHELDIQLNGDAVDGSPLTFQIQQRALPSRHDATFQCEEVCDHLDPLLATKAKNAIKRKGSPSPWSPPRIPLPEVTATPFSNSHTFSYTG